MKLVTVTRKDLPFGDILAQTVHSSTTFARHQTAEFQHWFDNSNFVACLATKDEQELIDYYNRLLKAGAPVVLFREPERNNEATSLAFFGDPTTRRITSSLPLMFKAKPVEGQPMT